MAYVRTDAPSGSTPALRLAAAAIRLAAGASAFVAAEIDRRRTAHLLSLDDSLLRDIGVSRGDVEGALLTEFGTKASHRLAKRREERRAADLDRLRDSRRGAL